MHSHSLLHVFVSHSALCEGELGGAGINILFGPGKGNNNLLGLKDNHLARTKIGKPLQKHFPRQSKTFLEK